MTAIFWAKCTTCQHVDSFTRRPDRCPACDAPLHVILPVSRRPQQKLEQRQRKKINGSGRPWSHPRMSGCT